MTRDWHQKIIDVRETRLLASPLQMRDDGAATGSIVLEGYASTFEPYDVFGGPNAGGWIEQLDQRAFDKTLGARPDVQLLVNHEGLPLARTKSGTLELSVDGHGLKVRAMLDKSDPDVQRLLPKMLRSDLDEMSFAFRVTSQGWSSDYTRRTITEVNLQKGDVSVVNYGMNPTTSAALSETLNVLASRASLSPSELVEIRAALGLPAEPARGAAQQRPSGTTVVADGLRELGLLPKQPAYAPPASQRSTSTTTTVPRALDGYSAQDLTALTAVPTDPTSDAHLTYRRGSARFPETERTSWIRDLLKTKTGLDGDGESRARLKKHAHEVKTDPAYREWRDLSRVDGEGGYIGVPPKWLIDEYVLVARPGRAFADLCRNEVLPSGCDSVNLPRMVSGTAAAIQPADNSEITDVDLTDTFISAPVATCAGQIGCSIQLLEQAPLDLSAILFRDLVAAHATQVDLQVIAGSGVNGQMLGIDNTVGIQSIEVSSTSISGFYTALAQAIYIINTTRFEPPEVVTMHPVRFAWLCSLVDEADRPLVQPYANPVANTSTVLQKVAAERIVGQIMGLPIVIDSSVTITGGSDVVYVMRSSDLLLWESSFKLVVRPELKAPNLTSTLQAWNYAAFTAERYMSSVVRVTGLTAPEF